MRKILIIAALLCASSAAGAASADYYLKIEAVSRPTVAGPIYLKVSDFRDTDSDGDTIPDEAILRLNCAGGKLRAAHYNVKSPRDSASGMASGKRTHHPVTFVKEWGPSTPQLRALKVGYDLKSNTKARVTSDGWQMVSLTNADGLCAAAQNGVVTKSRSNIQNN